VYFAPRWRWRKPRNKLPQEGWPEITTPTPKPKEQPAWIRHTQEIFFYAIKGRKMAGVAGRSGRKKPLS
jgi:hypothetical protein